MSVHVTIEGEAAERLDRLVSGGRYATREEALGEAIRMAMEEADWLSMVRAKVAEGRAQIARGEGIPLEEAFDRLAARYADR